MLGCKFRNISIVAIVLISLFFVWRAWQANTDFADGRYLLNSIERVSFDNVINILRAPSFGGAVLVSMEGDARYGHGLYNISSLVAWFPWKIFGDRGVIVADRMLQAFFLLVAYLLLTFVFVRSWPLRVLTVAALLCLPSTTYYTILPKPEPLQFFCLGLFLYFACRENFIFGWYYFFLGCALGLKISMLIPIPFFIAVSLHSHRRSLNEIVFYRRVLMAFISGVIGYMLMQGTLIKCFIVRNIHPFELYVASLRQESHVSGDISSHLYFWLTSLFTAYFQQPFV